MAASLANTTAMASNSSHPVNKSILTPVMTLEGHEPFTYGPDSVMTVSISSICYFPDGKRMISGSGDKTARQWDLQEGKEIEGARIICEQRVDAVGVSMDGRWIVTAGGDHTRGEAEICEVETGMVRTCEHSLGVYCIDISADSTLLATGFAAAQIWTLDTGTLFAGPFGCGGPDPDADGYISRVGTVRFSPDSKKLALSSWSGYRLEMWDIQTQKLDAGVGWPDTSGGPIISGTIFWTPKGRTIVSPFSLTGSGPRGPVTIYEFDASTMETVGVPFEAHTKVVTSLALSADGALLASASWDENTIKLWAFESRQLLSSFDVHIPYSLILSPNSLQLAYTTNGKIHIYITPPDILARAHSPKNFRVADLLNSDATRHAVRRKPARPVIYPAPRQPRRLPTTNPQQPTFFRYLRKLLSSRMDAVLPVRNDPLDFPATSPLPRSLSTQAIIQGHSDADPRENSRSTPPPPTTRYNATTTFEARLHHLSTWWPVHAGDASPPIIDVPLAQGKERNAAAGAPRKNEDLICDEDYVPSRPPSPNPNSQQPSVAAQIKTGEHGSGRFCGCF